MSDKIKFSELVKSFSESTNLTQQKAERLIRGVFNLLLEDLEKEGKASITNFGSFELKEVAERTGINPQTGEEIIIPAHKKVSFRPYKALESTVNAPFAHLESRLIDEDAGNEKEVDKDEEVAFTDTESKKEEIEEEIPVIKTKEDVNEEDPFESVIAPVEEKLSSETEEEEPDKQEVAPPPIYTTKDKKEGSSSSIWLMVILLLIVVGVGAWYFFLRDTGFENEVAENSNPVASEQETTPQNEPPVVNAEPETSTAANDPIRTTDENSSSSEIGNTAATTQKEAPKEMTTYIIKKDEWMWDISRKVYGKSYLWPLIFESNKNVNNDPNLVEPAKTLIIPALEGNASALTKSDYSNLAKAAKMVSDAYANAGNQERSAEYLRFSKKYEKRSE